MNENIARNHHYVSQCYLTGFLPEPDEEENRLTVLDFKNKKTYLELPKKVGAKKDFNRVDIDGVAPDFLEKQIGSLLEGKVAEAIKELEDTRQWSEFSYHIMMQFVAMLAMRNPMVRNHLDQFLQETMQACAHSLVSSEEKWNSVVDKLKADGHELDENSSYENMKDFVKGGECEIKANKEFLIGLDFQGANTLLPLLEKRTWNLISTNRETGFFVTSNRPVCCCWFEPDKIPPIMRNMPPLVNPKTEIIFPISKRLAMIGVYGQKQLPTIPADKESVAKTNSHVINLSNDQIYSSDYVGQDGNMKTGKDVVKFLEGQSTSL